MQDNIVYRLELTDKEYKFLESLKNELYDKLSNMKIMYLERFQMIDLATYLLIMIKSNKN